MTIIAGAADCSSGLAKRVFANFCYDSKWVASQAGYQVGARACPTVPNGFGYQVQSITTGVTGSSEPTWPVVLTGTVVDGGVTWVCQEVANPTGRLQSLNPGYVLSASDLDGFRLLAWDIAKALIDEVNANKVDLASQASSSLGGSVALQASTPGTQQTGHSNISGTAIVGGLISVGTASPGGITQEAWTAPSLVNGWAAVGGGYVAPGYFKDSQGIVHLRGLLINAAGTAAGNTIFNLPLGYRPSGTLTLAAQDLSTGAGAYRRTDLASGGNLSVQIVVAVNTYLSLDGINFDTR